jgi:hypothetical protein
MQATAVSSARASAPRAVRRTNARRLPGQRRGDARGPMAPPTTCPRLPSFVVKEPTSRELVGTVELAWSPLLDKSLRGRVLVDDRAGGVRGPAADRGTVLAACEGEILWHERTRSTALPWRQRSLDRTTRSAMRSCLPGGSPCFRSCFLRDVAGELRWTRPPTQAMIIVNDPILHWWSYGLVDFRRLAGEARGEGHHVAMATIPLDALLVHRGAARLFREKQGSALAPAPRE